MTNPQDRKFYEYLREERQFSFLLAHLLMQHGDALARFVDLVREKNPAGLAPNDALSLDDAEVYVEFAILRDQWDCLLRDQPQDPGARARANLDKRNFIASKFRAIPSLRFLGDGRLPETNSEFNAFFMGPAGRRIAGDIASPGLWSVTSLASKWNESGWGPEVFRDLCQLKWAFNIKPDLVIKVPGLRTVCVEAKLESGEGSYPTRRDEVGLFDAACGPTKRVGQFELQKFLFKHLLDDPCLPVVVQKFPPPNQPEDGVVLTWHEVLICLADDEHLASSIPFVRHILRGNRALLGSRADLPAG